MRDFPVPGDRKGVSNALTTLWPLIGRPVALHRGLVELCGGVKTALMLSQAIYWTRKGVAIAEMDGWFHKRMEDWQLEIGLRRRTQERARKHLLALGVLEQRLHGLPAQLEFRVNLEQLANLLTKGSEAAQPMREMMSLFGAPLAFHTSLAKLTDSVAAGLLLSNLLHFTRRRVMDGVGNFVEMPWIALAATRWMATTGLSRREFDGARNTLQALALITERLRGIPPILEMRVEIMALGRQLSQQIPQKMGKPVNLYVLDNQDCEQPAITVTNDAHSSLSKMYKSDWPEHTKQVGPIAQNGLAESAKTLLDLTTAFNTSLLQPPIQVETSTPATTPCGGANDSSLIYPHVLTSIEKQAVSNLLRNVQQKHAQLILDELEGRLHHVGATGIPNRVGYVRRLRDLHLVGGFVPETALSVQATRLRKTEERARRVIEAEDREKAAAIAATPEAKKRREQALAQTKALLGISGAGRSTA
ncbi:MAG: hypothetical protein V4568_01680 [Pseudomonadota bacterium]